MDRIVLSVRPGQSELTMMALGFRFPAMHLALVAGSIGRRLLLNDERIGGRHGYFATARITAIHQAYEGGQSFAASLADLVYLFKTVPLTPEHASDVPTEAGLGLRTVTQQAYDIIVAAGDEEGIAASFESQIKGLSESTQPGMTHDLMSVAGAPSPHHLALYDYRCAFTGERGQSAPGYYPGVELVLIRPIELGGSPDWGNVTPAGPAARAAFSAGHLTLGPDFGFIAALDKIDPELLESLNANGRLILPPDRRLWPDPAALAYHRTRIFNPQD